VRTESLERACRGRRARVAIAIAVGLFWAAAFAAAPANAKLTRVFLENLGSAQLQSFEYAQSAAVDQSSGDVLVVDAEADHIASFHPDGTPSNFADLGTNIIDGVGSGPPCTPPSTECDGTPQNGLKFGFDPNVVQIAVDNSGTATDGNIYITQSLGLEAAAVQEIDIFDAGGEYIGRLTGPGAGSFSAGGGFASPCGVAVDPKGNVYVGGYESNAVYKFVPAANPPVNADYIETPFTSPTPCSLAAGAGPTAGSIFAVEFLGQDVFKLNSSSGVLAYIVHHSTANNEHPQRVSVDPGSGHVFVTTSGGETPARVIEYDASQSSSATLITSFAEGSNGVAVDETSGKLYLVRPPEIKIYSPLAPLPDVETGAASNIEKTSATLNGTIEAGGEELTECFFEYGLTTAYGSSAPCAESFPEIGTGFAKVHADISGLDEETAYHYRLIAGNVNGRGDPGKDRTFKTKSKPELLGEWAEGVTLHEATLKASINPQSAATTYRFEWGLHKGPPYEHSTADIAIGSEPTPHTVSLFLQNLKAGARYHFRVVAENEMGASGGLDHAFLAFETIPPPSPGSCPANEELRTDASAFLPDCRAYEMVSPVDKNGEDIANGLSGVADPGGYAQAAPDGEKIAYSARFASFAGAPSSLAFNQYIASRHERGDPGEGWSSEGIHPPVPGRQVEGNVLGVGREFIAFSPDLCGAWLIDYQTPPLTGDAQSGYPNLYRREGCGPLAGDLEALTASPLSPLTLGAHYVTLDSVQGVSADARHAFFIAKAKLIKEAHGGDSFQIFDRFGGESHLVSVLPGGTADPTPAEVGSGTTGNLHNAVSTDGSLVYWTSSGDGRIYLRRHPELGIVKGGECGAPTTACTLAVSAGSAFFWAAAADGSAALYSESEDLHEFDLQGGSGPAIAHHVKGVTGASEDLSRVYFVSTDALSGAGKNSEGDKAQAGEPNLYLHEGGDFSFIGTLVAGDLGVSEPGVGTRAYNLVGSPYERATRVSPDGSRIVFESRAALTGYDNTDSASGKPAVEVFTYEAGGELSCVSCNPSGGRPKGVRELGRPYQTLSGRLDVDKTLVPAAAWIPTWEHPLHASNVLSADGGRIFFNANDPLLPRDTNGIQDVYEWEAAGSGGCHTGAPDYFAQNGGCLYLVSSGESPSESEFWEASPDGEDVFFTTASSLLPEDPGSVDLYDARVDGGFPQPIVKAPCEGEACQSPPPPPAFSTPASSAYRGPGNPPRGKQSCPKGKHRAGKGKKARCVKKKHKSKGKAQHKRRAKSDRRVER
jgi:hypothetical protein